MGGEEAGREGVASSGGERGVCGRREGKGGRVAGRSSKQTEIIKGGGRLYLSMLCWSVL